MPAKHAPTSGLTFSPNPHMRRNRAGNPTRGDAYNLTSLVQACLYGPHVTDYRMNITNQRLPARITYLPTGLDAGSSGREAVSSFRRWSVDDGEVGRASSAMRQRGVSRCRAAGSCEGYSRLESLVRDADAGALTRLRLLSFGCKCT